MRRSPSLRPSRRHGSSPAIDGGRRPCFSSDATRVVEVVELRLDRGETIRKPAFAHRAARRARPPSPPSRWRRRPVPRHRSRRRRAARRRRRGWRRAPRPDRHGPRRACPRPARRGSRRSRPPCPVVVSTSARVGDTRVDDGGGGHDRLGPGGVGGEVLVHPREQVVALGGGEGDAGDELLGGQLEHDGVADGADRGGPGRAPQDADLAERVAGAVASGSTRSLPSGSVCDDLDLAGLHHVEVGGRVALLDHRLTGGDLHLGELALMSLPISTSRPGKWRLDVAAGLAPEHLGRVERLVGGPAPVDERRAERR